VAAPAAGAAAAAAKAALVKALKRAALKEAIAEAKKAVKRAFKLLLASVALLVLLLTVVLLPVLIIIGMADPAQGSCGSDQTGNASDPIDMPAMEIATRIYEVGRQMGMDDRRILTAFTVALVESGGGETMRNAGGGDHTSTGVFQQQDFPEWTKGANGEPRNRNNVSDAARTFFERLPSYDHGQSIGELAADIQRPREDLRWKYGAALPRAQVFLARVEAQLGAGESADANQQASVAPADGCGAVSPGPANLSQSETLYQPRDYKMLPASLMAGGREPEAVDARIWDDVVWALQHYNLRATAGRETGHNTHGDGTAVDVIPADSSSVADWERTTERFARDLGWRPACESTGCYGELVGSIQFIGYNGFPGHGDPAHCSGDCPAHLHVSWKSSCYACGDGALVPPREWVRAFPVEGGQP
jgi:hypothetical protein